MKQPPELEQAQRRMVPGVVSLHGFLGTDRRNLLEILTADQDTVNGLGLTHEQIADRLRQLTDRAKAGLGSTVVVDDRYELSYEEVRGMIGSPFATRRRFPKDTVHLKDRQSGETLQWSTLTIHLIREQGFYEGLGSPYRVDPARAARVLGIEPEGE